MSWGTPGVAALACQNAKASLVRLPSSCLDAHAACRGLPFVEFRETPERPGAQHGQSWHTRFARSVMRTRFGCTTALNCFLSRAAPLAAATHAQLCATLPTVAKACS